MIEFYSGDAAYQWLQLFSYHPLLVNGVCVLILRVLLYFSLYYSVHYCNLISCNLYTSRKSVVRCYTKTYKLIVNYYYIDPKWNITLHASTTTENVIYVVVVVEFFFLIIFNFQQLMATANTYIINKSKRSCLRIMQIYQR